MVNQNSLELIQDNNDDHDNVIYLNFAKHVRRLTKNLFLKAEKIQNDEPFVAEELYLKSIEKHLKSSLPES